MRIILKYLLNNIREKKFRSVILMLTILLSTALVFSSLTISDTLGRMYVEQMRKYYGSAEIMVSPKRDSPSPFVSERPASKLSGEVEYVIDAVQKTGFHKEKNRTTKLQLLGIDLMDLRLMNPYELLESKNMGSFKGNKIIISSKTAELLNCGVGDAVPIEIDGKKQKFSVAGIARPFGYFVEFGDEHMVVMPKQSLGALSGIQRNSNVLYIKTADAAEKPAVLDQLRQLYSRYSVEETITDEEIKEYSGRIQMAFSLVVTAVLFMSVFIIYTAFKIIVIERMPAIGTLRSLGATNRMVSLVLYLESLLYGLAGGALGLFSGIGILHLLALMAKPPGMETLTVTVTFAGWQLLAAFLVAVLTSVLSAAVPIRKVHKIPIKDIVLNQFQHEKEQRKIKYVFGAAMLGLALFLPGAAPFGIALLVDMLCIFLVVFAMIIFIPLLVGLTSHGLSRIPNLSNICKISAKNLRGNKSVNTNICLLAISISVLLLMNSTGGLVVEAATNLFRDMKFDAQVTVDKTGRSFERLLKGTSGVESAYGVYDCYNVEILNSGTSIPLVRGVDTARFDNYYEFFLKGEPVDYLDRLNEGRTIVVTDFLARTSGFSIGDELVLKTERGAQAYEIIGFFDSIEQLGGMALISEKNLKTDMKLDYYTAVNIKTTGDSLAVQKSIEEKYSVQNPVVSDMAKMREDTIQANKQLFVVLTLFSILILAISLIGMINNLIVSFLERRRSFAMYRSVGMNKRQLANMVMLESIVSGLIGGCAGVAGGTFLIGIVPYVLEATGFVVSIKYDFATYWIYVVLGTAVMLAASIAPSIKTSKFSIIDALKYE